MTDPDWRSRHCAEAAAAELLRATGRDIWAEWGGCPRSWRAAADLYRRLGVRCLKDAVSAAIGEPLAPSTASHGDIAMIDGALGIVHGQWAVRCIDRWHPIWRAECVWKLPRS